MSIYPTQKSMEVGPGEKSVAIYSLAQSAERTFSTSAYDETLRDDKGAYRLDHNSHWGTLSAYYFLDDYTLNNPYPVAQSGARSQASTRCTLGERNCSAWATPRRWDHCGQRIPLHLHARSQRSRKTRRRAGRQPGISGICDRLGNPGIVPLNPQGEGVENIVFNAFSIGTNANELKQVNNTFQWTDNFSKVVGRHTAKFGAGISLRPGQYRPHRAIQRQFSFHRERDGI